MKFVEPLDEQTRNTLSELARNSPNARLRQRAHAVLLSNKHYKIDTIADIFDVDRDTVSRWLSNWRAHGFDGLYDEPRSGRPRKLGKDDQDRALMITLEAPRQIKLGLARIEQELGLRLSLDGLRALLRRGGYHYKRIRASVKMKRDERAFRQAQFELAALQRQEAQGSIQLYYFDESGFALRPSLPYAWQAVGERIEVEHTGRAQVNVLGFLQRSGHFVPFISEEAITSETVIACMDYFAQRIERETVVVIDNAPVHTSHAFKACLSRWKEQGLTLKFLPSYTPELNLIEHLWKKIKYLWMPVSAYKSFKALKQALEEILIGIGTKYRITFS